MRIKRPVIYKIIVTFCCISVAACAPIKTGTTERNTPLQETAPEEQYTSSEWELSDTSFATLLETDADLDGMLQEDIEPEPEQTKEQEILDLQRLGTWEPGVPAQEYSKEKVEYDFPVTVNRQVEYYLDFFTGRGRKSFGLWLARSGRYLPLIHKHLVEAGLPQDLAYLAMIESGFNERAHSRAKAVGIWQFIKSTGRIYGLEINSYVDERRDPIKSTRAAVAYLSLLYDEFGSWHLAVAAYNAGEGKIRKAISRYNTTDFWEIAQGKYLKLETKRYVPKLIAAIIIAKEPEKYGFDNISYEAPLDYDIVEVPRWTSVKAVALACNTEQDEVRKYNNELRREFTPPDNPSYPFKVPVGKGQEVDKNLPRVQAVVSTGFKTHIVRAGETLNAICRKYNLTKTVVLKSNNLRSAGLQPGQRLRIPYQTTKYEMLPEGKVAKGYLAAEAADGSFIIHKVRPGDTVYELSKIYNVPVHLLAAWNDLPDISRIRAGQQLVLYVRKTENSRLAGVSSSGNSRVKQLAPEQVKEEAKVYSGQHGYVELAASHREADIPASAGYYLVKEGDSLWSIAKRYNLDTRELRSLNGLASNVIHPGDRLLVGNASDQAAAEFYYEVRNGDSLWSIARRHNLDIRELRNRNGLDSNVIHPGDKLLVWSASDQAAAEIYYEVRSGDSLWTIARQHDISPDEIMYWNNLHNNTIHPGNRLLLRVAAAGESMVDTYYKVRSGDSLWSIARQYNITPEEIKKWNNLKNSTIHPGSRLVLKIASGG